jgi:hypothetical protein
MSMRMLACLVLTLPSWRPPAQPVVARAAQPTLPEGTRSCHSAQRRNCLPPPGTLILPRLRAAAARFTHGPTRGPAARLFDHSTAAQAPAP